MHATLSPLISQLSGSLGYLCAARNRYGSYFRYRNGPDNSGSAYWQYVRNNQIYLSRSWSGLSFAQKNAWNDASLVLLKSFAFGRKASLPGYNYFLSCNNNLYLCGLPFITTPPTPQAVVMPDNISLTYDVLLQNLVISYINSLPSNYYTKIYITDPVSSGISFFTNRLRLLVTLQSNLLTNYDISSLYSARFSTPFKISDQFFFKIINFDSNSCCSSEPFVSRFEVLS